MNNDELNSAIAAHARWKGRLLTAIEQGKCDVSVADASRDDHCQFGKWLKETPGLTREQHYGKVKELHHKFHAEAGNVLSLALAGKKDAAKSSMNVGSPFLNVSSALTYAIVAWRDAK
ncbi:MAG: CZB domain-containing protein [Bryobacterales bacterium]|nr:CZB domain-containing protein [Bryobacterales bacterium]